MEKFKRTLYSIRVTAIKLTTLSLMIFIYILILKFVMGMYGLQLKANPITVASGILFALLVNHIYDYYAIRSQHAKTQRQVAILENRVVNIEKRILQETKNNK